MSLTAVLDGGCKKMSSRTRVYLLIAGLALLSCFPFATRFAWQRSAETDASVDRVTRLISQGRYDRAFRHLKGIDTTTADLTTAERARLAYQWVLCERALGMSQQAKKHLQKLAGKIPALKDYRQLWLARSFENLGERAVSAAAYRSLLDSSASPTVVDSARIYLADLYAASGELEKAAQLYSRKLGAGSRLRLPDLLHRLAQVYDSMPDPAAARRTRLRLMDGYPGDPAALKAAGDIRLTQNSAEAYALAHVYFRHQQYGTAARRLRSFLEFYPDDKRAGDAHHMLGRCYLKKGQHARALRTFARVYAEYGLPAALYRIGGIQVRVDDDAEAIDTYDRFVRAHPRHSLADDALWQAAKAAERVDEFGRAGKLYQRLVDGYGASPFLDEARWNTGFMFYCQQQYWTALKTFDAVSREARQPHIIDQSLYWAGKSAHRLNATGEAAEFFQRAASHFPRSYYSARAVRMGYAHPEGSPSLQAYSPEDSATADEAAIADASLRGSEGLARGALLAQLGLSGLAEAELSYVERLNRDDTAALRIIRDHYERLEILDRALLLSTRIFAAGKDSSEIPRLYPTYYWKQIAAAAGETGIDPHLVLSVIRQESYFDKGAVSRAGALGLMQIMPETGRKLARSMGVAPYERGQLLDPNVSIHMGTRFLGEQVRSFEEGPARAVRLELGLAAYNAGPRVARRWVARLPYDDPDAFVERIPYKETRLYVKKVLKNFTIYKTLSDV